MNVIFWGLIPVVLIVLLPFLVCLFIGLVISVFDDLKKCLLKKDAIVQKKSNSNTIIPINYRQKAGEMILKKIDRPTDYKLH